MIDAFHSRDFLEGKSFHGCDRKSFHGCDSYKRASVRKSFHGLFQDSVRKLFHGFIKSYHTHIHRTGFPSSLSSRATRNKLSRKYTPPITSNCYPETP